MNERQSYIELASVQIGGAICLPMILIGYELSRVDFLSAIVAVILGNCFLFFVAKTSSKMAYACQLSTTDNAARYFGKTGKGLFSLIIAFCMCSWFAIQTEVMAQDVSQSFGQTAFQPIISVLIATCVVLLSLGGINCIAKLANLAVPLMAVTLAVALVGALQQGTFSIDFEIKNLPKAFTMVVAASILAVVDLPTFFRHARSEKDVRLATRLIFLFGIPFVELIGVILGGLSSSENLLGAFFCIENPLWRAWIIVFFLLAGTTTNNTNLYSATQAFKSIQAGISCKKAAVLAGLVCIIFSACSFIKHLSVILECMAIALSSMGATIAAAFVIRQQESPLAKRTNLISWALGLSVGMGAIFFSIGITHIALVDAAFVAATSVIVMQKVGVYEAHS